MERIASFSVDHRVLEPGVYVSRRDADAATGCTTTTFDLRMTPPPSTPSSISAPPSCATMRNGPAA